MSYDVLGIGELLWDMLPTGKQVGGAPTNFVFHARSMGANASVISRVGDDPLGKELIEHLFSLGVPTCSVGLDPAHLTGVVEVTVAADGQPHYVIQEDAAWDHLIAEDLDSAAKADAICFGSLAQRNNVSRQTIRSLLKASKPEALRIFDVNLRQNFYCEDVVEKSLQLANVLKLNDAELPVIAALLRLKSESEKEQIAELAQRFDLRLVAYTRGSHGSWLFDGARWSEHPGIHVDVKDTVGAGDAFTAAVTMGMLLGWDIHHINDVANRVAAFVCSRAGGTPKLLEDVRREFTAAVPSSV
jgi:fructokinase